MNLNIRVKPGSLGATGLGAMGSCGEGNRNTGTLTIPVAFRGNGYTRQRNEHEVGGFRIGFVNGSNVLSSPEDVLLTLNE